MHGNHQNWKGNKGVPEGAPLSLHGGCLATPASRPLPAPSLLTPSALTPSQPFPPNHRRSPRRALSYPLHFFFSSLSSPVIRVSVQRNTDALFFSRRAIPRPRILGTPPHPTPTLRPLASSACFLHHSLFRSAVYAPPKEPPGFIPLSETAFLRPPPCRTCSSRGCILFLGECRSLSAPFQSFLASDTSTLSLPSLTEASLSLPSFLPLPLSRSLSSLLPGD